MKKKLDVQSYSFEDIINLSGVTGKFKELLIESSQHASIYAFFGHNSCYRETLQSIQEADKESCLNSKVLSLLKNLGLPLIKENNEWYPKYDGYYIHPYIVALAKYEWMDRSLEFYDYLMLNANYPQDKWLFLFRDCYNFGGKFIGFDKPYSFKPDHILEGLLRNVETEHTKDSPLSIKYWFNLCLFYSHQLPEVAIFPFPKCPLLIGSKETCEVPLLNNEEYKDHFYSFFYRLLYLYIIHLLENKSFEKIKCFYDWVRNTNYIFELDDNFRRLIDSSIASIPSVNPLKIDHLNQQDKIPIFINAIKSIEWEDELGNIYTRTEQEYCSVRKKLIYIFEAYSRDEISFSRDKKHDLVCDLIKTGFDLRLDLHLLEKIAVDISYLMRTRIKHEREQFNPYDYREAFSLIIKYTENTVIFKQLLKQLLITMQACPEPCSNEALEFRHSYESNRYNREQSKKNLNREPFKNMTPSQCVSCFIHIVIDGINNHHEISLSVAKYSLSRIKAKKGSNWKPDKSQSYYADSLCMEENPIWRRAHVKVLGELGYDLDGSVHGPLKFVRDHDPDEQVRKEAKRSLKAIKREITKNLDDRKSLIASFFWLRWAQRESLGKEINEGLAMLTRHTDLCFSDDKEAFRLYNMYLIPKYY